jgi:hypothetical protein
VKPSGLLWGVCEDLLSVQAYRGVVDVVLSCSGAFNFVNGREKAYPNALWLEGFGAPPSAVHTRGPSLQPRSAMEATTNGGLGARDDAAQGFAWERGLYHGGGSIGEVNIRKCREHCYDVFIGVLEKLSSPSRPTQRSGDKNIKC